MKNFFLFLIELIHQLTTWTFWPRLLDERRSGDVRGSLREWGSWTPRAPSSGQPGVILVSRLKDQNLSSTYFICLSQIHVTGTIFSFEEGSDWYRNIYKIQTLEPVIIVLSLMFFQMLHSWSKNLDAWLIDCVERREFTGLINHEWKILIIARMFTNEIHKNRSWGNFIAGAVVCIRWKDKPSSISFIRMITETYSYSRSIKSNESRCHEFIHCRKVSAS